MLFLLYPPAVFADGPVCGAGKGPAIGGYDVVAYFTKSEAQKGSPEFKAEWSGATWHFADAGHRDLFLKAPEKYAPQYGGYCAYAMSKGGEADGDGERWKIVDGKLYLNNNWIAQKLWSKDIPSKIKDADGQWPKAKTKIRAGNRE